MSVKLNSNVEGKVLTGKVQIAQLRVSEGKEKEEHVSAGSAAGVKMVKSRVREA